MTISKAIAFCAVVLILAIDSDVASATSANRQSANFHGTCGQQVMHKHPGMKGADFKAEYSKCMNDTAAGKNYLTE